MRTPSILLLLSLLLIPLLWNGLSLVHHLVEHSHAFCDIEEEHQHPSAEDCHTICHLSPQHNPTQIPTKTIEFYELKQCITAFPFYNNQIIVLNASSAPSDYPLLYGRILSDNIFRPPIA